MQANLSSAEQAAEQPAKQAAAQPAAQREDWMTSARDNPLGLPGFGAEPKQEAAEAAPPVRWLRTHL